MGQTAAGTSMAATRPVTHQMHAGKSLAQGQTAVIEALLIRKSGTDLCPPHSWEGLTVR